ncbi:hypothetical protein, partial [Pseudomonas aeruginosa]
VAKLDGAAGFLAAQDTNQSLGRAAFAEELADEFFFAGAAVEILVGNVVLGSELFAVVDELSGLVFEEGEEILAARAENAIDKGVEV